MPVPDVADLYWQAAVFLNRNGHAPEALAGCLIGPNKFCLRTPRSPCSKRPCWNRPVKPRIAEHLLDRIQRRWPEGGAVWVARGIILAAHGHFEEARRALETAVWLGRAQSRSFVLSGGTLRSAPRRIGSVTLKPLLAKL